MVWRVRGLGSIVIGVARGLINTAVKRTRSLQGGNTRIIPILLVTALLNGCATQAQFEADMNGWVGHNVNDFIASWGITPTQVLDDVNSGKMYVFNVSRTSSYTTPATTKCSAEWQCKRQLGKAITSDGQTYQREFSCQWIFRTTTYGVIRQWSARGNSCRARSS